MKQINNLPALGFGAMRLPDNYDKSEQLVLYAIENGVDYFDTAYIYPGKEVLLGKILHNNNIREKVKIATKLPLILTKNTGDFDKFFDKQLNRLKTNYIDYYMLHMLNNPDEFQALLDMGLLQWVENKRKSGAIRNFGFSFHGTRENFIKLINMHEWDFTMIQYNYLDVNTQAGLTGLQYAHSKNIPVIIMEPLRGGLLANPKQIPKKALELLQPSPVEWALKWLWNHKEVSCVLSGMRNMSDLQSNITLADTSFPDCMSEQELSIIEQVTSVFAESHSIPCTGCNYCIPHCPVNVNIADCFMAFNAKSYSMYVQSNGMLTSKAGSASCCIGCGKCEPYCPQSIPIKDSLKIVSRKMEPWWFRLAMPIIRCFTGRKHSKEQIK